GNARLTRAPAKPCRSDRRLVRESVGDDQADCLWRSDQALSRHEQAGTHLLRRQALFDLSERQQRNAHLSLYRRRTRAQRGRQARQEEGRPGEEGWIDGRAQEEGRQKLDLRGELRIS